MRQIEIGAQDDNFDGICALHMEMLRGQFEHENNGLVKTKYHVLTVEAKDIKTAGRGSPASSRMPWAISRSWVHWRRR